MLRIFDINRGREYLVGELNAEDLEDSGKWRKSVPNPFDEVRSNHIHEHRYGWQR